MARALILVLAVACSETPAENVQLDASSNADTVSPSDASTMDASGDGTVDSGPTSCVPAPTSPTVVDVKAQGALGNGVANDTAAIQKAVDLVAGSGGTVLVPAGTYRIDALIGIQLKSQMTFRLAPGAILQAIPNNQGNYQVVEIRNASNVNVVGGTFEGERGAHSGTTGEWGHGLTINSSKNVVVEDVLAKECWGDGFYVGGSGTSNVSFCKVVADHNRRQGMSITFADGIVVRDSTFKNTTGTEPEAGIDIEPNLGEIVTNVLITTSKFEGNAGGGLQIGPAIADMATTFVTKTTVVDNTFTGNGVGAISPPNYGIQLSACTGDVLQNNTLTNNSGIGIGVLYTTNATVKGNTVTGTKVLGPGEETGAGVILENDNGTTCTANTVTGNAGHGIFTYMSNANVTGNTVSGNGKLP
jgi:parallel beta-helix repeat protein